MLFKLRPAGLTLEGTKAEERSQLWLPSGQYALVQAGHLYKCLHIQCIYRLGAVGLGKDQELEPAYTHTEWDHRAGTEPAPSVLKSRVYFHGDVFCFGKGTCNQPQPAQDFVAERSRTHTPDGGNTTSCLTVLWTKLYLSFFLYI